MGYVLRRWREVLIVILSLVCYYLYSRPINQPTPIVKTEYITKTKHEKEFIRVTEPGGRIVEKTIERGETTQEKETAKVLPNFTDKPKYSVGASYDPKQARYQLDTSYRLGKSPISLTAGASLDPYNLGRSSVLVGARVDW